jgi:hypothetical protein
VIWCGGGRRGREWRFGPFLASQNAARVSVDHLWARGGKTKFATLAIVTALRRVPLAALRHRLRRCWWYRAHGVNPRSSRAPVIPSSFVAVTICTSAAACGRSQFLPPMMVVKRKAPGGGSSIDRGDWRARRRVA